MNFSPINQKLSYENSSPINYSSSLLKSDVLTGNNLKQLYGTNNINLSIETKQEFAPINKSNLATTALKGMIETNSINKIFFSAENIVRLQKKIKLAIYERSGRKFKLEEDQDESDLIVVMRAVYFDNCRNLEHNPIRQVKQLNDKVVEYIVPDMLTNIRQCYGYIRDISSPITPPMRPIGTTSAGRRLIPSYTTMWK